MHHRHPYTAVPQTEVTIPRFASESGLQIDSALIPLSDALVPSGISGAYQQYVVDPDDSILVDAYFRKIMNSQRMGPLLPPDVSRIIATYYIKGYSTRTINRKIHKAKGLINYI